MIKDEWYNRPFVIDAEKNNVFIGKTLFDPKNPDKTFGVYKYIENDPIHFKEFGYPFEFGFFVARKNDEDSFKMVSYWENEVPLNEYNLKMAKELYQNPLLLDENILKSVFEFSKEHVVFYNDIVKARLKDQPLDKEDEARALKCVDELNHKYKIENIENSSES